MITPISALRDNYIWLIAHEHETVCVDPGDAAPVLHYLQQHGCSLNAIWLTHRHYDHTDGVAALQKAFPQCRVYGAAEIPQVTDGIIEGDKIPYAAGEVIVWATPGHTREHMAFLLHDRAGRLHVFCGDTLFSAGCGRVFDGTAAQLQQSLARFNTLPEHTLFYPAHEYTANNLRFAAEVEPDNSAIARTLAAGAHVPTLPVTLAHEREINPFLRFQTPQIRRSVAEHCKINANDDTAVFAALRAWKNEW